MKGDKLSVIGKHEEAFQIFDHSINISPDNYETYTCKGMAYQEMGNYE